MLKAVSVIAACAALAAAGIIVLPGLSLDVEASASTDGKADRADTADCQLRSWPYYDRSCLRDETRNASRVPAVRVVTTDRIGDVPGNEDKPAPAAPLPATGPGAEAPADWPMQISELRIYIAAGDFIRRTVPQ